MDNTSTTTEARPKLWNPNAALGWSFIFTPILGAWLHAKNWRVLNQPERAQQSMIWVYVGFVLLIVYLFLPVNVNLIGSVFLVSWYFLSANKQVKYLKENNISYAKKGWVKPLLLGLAGLIIYVLITALVG